MNRNEMDERKAGDHPNLMWCNEGYRLEKGHLIKGVPRKNDHDCSFCGWGSCDFL